MQIERFECFVIHVREHPQIRTRTVRLDFFRRQGDAWITEAGNEVSRAKLAGRLTLAHNNRQPRRETRSRWAYFPIAQLGTVVRAEFERKPSRSTRQTIADFLDICRTQADNEFDADHDSLTGLLNRRGVDRAVNSICSQVAPNPGVDATIAAGAPTSSAVLALDIDFFKQVNDSFGHDYGDLVLRVFAQRITDCCSKLEKTHAGSVKLVAGRLGGEEFLVVAAGTLTRDRLSEFAEQLRVCIWSSPLPSSVEWAHLQPPPDSTIRLPSEAERALTTSIGVSTLRPLLDPKIVESQRRQADQALYRAKGSGRNQYCHFVDITHKYGRVLQHHKGTNVVAIDIGRSVGVKVGQDFHVFHPEFSGTAHFYAVDQRTRRKLGTYPRYSSGRIVVFDTQEEISFCEVPDNSGGTEFPAGSHLEAIQAGSISHLVAPRHRLHAGPGLLNALEGDSVVASAAESKQLRGVAVFDLLSFDELVERLGIAAANETLAAVYRAIKEEDSSLHTAQIGSGTLAIIIAGDSELKPKLIAQSIFRRAATNIGGSERIRCGLYIPDTAHISDLDKSRLSDSHGIRYARYAALVSDSGQSQISVFSARTASTVVYRSREKQDYELGAVDYTSLVQLGVDEALFHNHGALCLVYLSHDRQQAARLAIARAIELSPSDTILKLNRGFVENALGDTKAAQLSFCEALESEPSTAIPDIYLPLMVRVLGPGYFEENSRIARDTIIALVNKCLAIPSLPQDQHEALRSLLVRIEQKGTSVT